MKLTEIKNRVLKLYPSAYCSKDGPIYAIKNRKILFGYWKLFVSNADKPAHSLKNGFLGYWAPSEKKAWESALRNIIRIYNDPD